MNQENETRCSSLVFLLWGDPKNSNMVDDSENRISSPPALDKEVPNTSPQQSSNNDALQQRSNENRRQRRNAVIERSMHKRTEP